MNPETPVPSSPAPSWALTPEERPTYDRLVTECDPPHSPLTPEERPNYDRLITEDDTPVDNFASEKQQRLLVEPLYTSWENEGRPFLAAANVGVYFSEYEPPLVPDFLLSLEVAVPKDWWAKAHRVYFSWIFGKMPDVVAEIVSNCEGGEADHKLRSYARLGVSYYVIYDPQKLLGNQVLRILSLQHRTYKPLRTSVLPAVGLGLKLWQGSFEGRTDQWLRWCDRHGQILLTGAERAEQERLAKEQAEQRAERLAAQLRALGVKPTE